MSFGQFGFNQVQISFGGLTWTGGMAPGVSTITAIDSNFNGDEFLSYAQGAFLRVMAARAAGNIGEVRPLVSDSMYSHLQAMGKKDVATIDHIEYATVYDARHDASWDTVTVRFAAKTTAKKKNDFLEDWTFQRPAASGQAPLPKECPSCGAPLTLDDNGGCKYCRVQVGGARGGWKLVRTGPPSTGTNAATAGVGARRRSGARGWVAFWVIFMILMTVVLPIGIWYAVDQSTGDVFDTFSGSGDTPEVSSKSSSGGTTATATFSGAITGPIEGSVTTVGGTSGPCISRATDISGFTFLHTTEDASGASQTVTITMTYPEGSKGAGAFDLATTPFQLTATYAATPDPAAGGAPTAQTWIPGPLTTATFELTTAAAGNLVFANLVPASPAAEAALGEPLSGSLDFAC
jgi:hypothetical protein